MAGKTKAQKKRLAKTRKLANEQLKQKEKKMVANQPTEMAIVGEKKTVMSKIAEQLPTEPTDVLDNNGEPPSPKVNEDAQKDKQIMASVPKPFDPNSVVANILKKKDEV